MIERRLRRGHIWSYDIYIIPGCTSTFQAGPHIHTRRLEAGAVLQLPPAVAPVEAEAAVDPEVAPVQLPAFQDGRYGDKGDASG